MDKKNKAAQIITILKKAYPGAYCSLHHKSPFQLLAATILSAQCTDERVNLVTPALFRKYPGPAEMAKALLPDLEKLVRSTGFYRNKALSLKEASRAIADNFSGKVPRTMDELLTLRGVARKTGNAGTDPEKIERDLMKAVPQGDWIWFAHALVLHGRAVCGARKPLCAECRLNAICPKKGVK
jgi:endonuclease-3